MIFYGVGDFFFVGGRFFIRGAKYLLFAETFQPCINTHKGDFLHARFFPRGDFLPVNFLRERHCKVAILYHHHTGLDRRRRWIM